MFGRTNSDTNKQGTVTIPFRFVWPYGGRRVLLSGSFARWQDHIPMSPMEGCPTVFQVIYPLTPGHHQYKFFVDGEWRHDEHQPHVSGTYGVVNTISLARDSDSVPANLGYDTAGRSSMEVDGDPLPPEANSSTSQAELDLSRIRVSTFLSSHTAYELLPESGKVIALDINLPVKQAFHILYEQAYSSSQIIFSNFVMYELAIICLKVMHVSERYNLNCQSYFQGISVAPLWDFCKSQFIGVLSASDFILILRELGNHGSNLTEEELETHTISAWKEGKAHLTQQTSGSYLSRLVHAGSYDSLKDVALKLLQSKFSTVPIIHSSSPYGPCPHLLHLASLSGILKCICRHFRYSSSSLPILQKPICSFPLGTWVPKIGETSGKPIAMLRPNASLSAALSLLIQADVSSIPIVDENDSLVDIYCRSDITALAKDRVYAQVHLDDLSVHQAIQLGQDASSPHGFFSGQRCQMCLRSDPLQKVMERLSIPGVRRVIIVEAGSKRVEGIISLSDVFRFLLG